MKIKCPDCQAASSLAFEEGCLKCHGNPSTAPEGRRTRYPGPGGAVAETKEQEERAKKGSVQRHADEGKFCPRTCRSHPPFERSNHGGAACRASGRCLPINSMDFGVWLK